MLGPSQVHISVPLTNFALQYKQLEYLGYQIAPIVGVRKEADKYWVFDQDRANIAPINTKRGLYEEAVRVKMTTGEDTYSCDEYAASWPVPDRIRDNADDPVRPMQRGTQQAINMLDLDKETRLKALFQTFGAAPLAPGANVSNKWNVTAGDPKADIMGAKSVIRKAAGVEPNSILLSAEVADALVRKIEASLNSLDLRTKLSFIDLPSILWGLKVYIARGVYRTNNMGISTPTTDYIWSDNVTVFYMDPTPAIDVMSFVYTFQSRPHMVKEWREESKSATVVEASRVEVEKMVCRDCAYVLGDVL